MSTVELQHLEHGITTVRLNRPEALNALTWEAMERFADIVSVLEEEKDLRAIVIYGADGAFCSGGDLYQLHDAQSQEDGQRLAEIMGDALERWAALPCVTIAAIEGPAFGGGAEIALACDLRIMAEDARFGMMHVKLAIPPAWGGGQRLLHLIGYGRALEWLTTARVISADEAHEYGIANATAATGHAVQKGLDLAQRIAGHDPGAVRAVKRLLRAGLHRSHEAATRVEREEFPPLWAAQPHLEASQAFVNRKRNRSTDQ
ncbi:MAG: enoyl-CoA hydratase/isomerase family protein [Anaerolineales bacterium]|nr:enoyl-CoA hydratase/isomerase family protein [Anaerolineales bacterium]